MLAERLPSILPELDDEAALEVTALHSVAGLLPPGGGLLRRPPLQAPHHTATVAALVGGGSGLARPGAVSLAHRGVLFLDEAPEFSKGALEALRQPLESGRVRVARTRGATSTRPAPNWCWRPTPVRARSPPATSTASARPWPGDATWDGCRVRCSTGWTCRSG